MQALFDEILHRRIDGRRAVMIVVTSTGGSTPRKTGARMFVTADGTNAGTIGGGWLELEAERIAHGMMTVGEPSKVVSFGLRGPERSNTPMICGGDVELLFQRL